MMNFSSQDFSIGHIRLLEHESDILDAIDTNRGSIERLSEELAILEWEMPCSGIKTIKLYQGRACEIVGTELFCRDDFLGSEAGITEVQRVLGPVECKSALKNQATKIRIVDSDFSLIILLHEGKNKFLLSHSEFKRKWHNEQLKLLGAK